MAENEHNLQPGDEEQLITLIDDNGDEELYQVLFTFDSEDYGKSYVLLYKDGAGDDEEVDIQAFSFVADETAEDPETSQGDLYPIEDDEEWKMVDEVLRTFLAEGWDGQPDAD